MEKVVDDSGQKGKLGIISKIALHFQGGWSWSGSAPCASISENCKSLKAHTKTDTVSEVCTHGQDYL